MLEKTLYLGLDASRYKDKNVQEASLIATRKLPTSSLKTSFSRLDAIPYVIITSRSAMKYFFSVCEELKISWRKKTFFVVGEGTKELLTEKRLAAFVANPATQEGMIALLQGEKGPYFWPKSARARPILGEFLAKNFPYSHVFTLYETVFLQKTLPLKEASKLVFTSSSTVDAFYALYPDPPKHLLLEATGTITMQYLLSKYPAHCIVRAF